MWGQLLVLLLPVTCPLLHYCLSLSLLRPQRLLFLLLLLCLLSFFLLLLLLSLLRCRQHLWAVWLVLGARSQSCSRQQPPLQQPEARMLLRARRVLGQGQRTSLPCT